MANDRDNVVERMDASKLTAALCDYVANELLEGEEAVFPESLFSEIGLDSLFMMELIVVFERLSGYRVSATILSSPRLASVQSLVDLVLEDHKDLDMFVVGKLQDRH